MQRTHNLGFGYKNKFIKDGTRQSYKIGGVFQ